LTHPGDPGRTIDWITADLKTISPSTPSTDDFDAIRRTVVHAVPERLPLAPVPIWDDICGDRIDLPIVYPGLDTGRWLFITGERTDIQDGAGHVIPGILDSELIMLAGVEQSFDPALPGDKPRTTLLLAGQGLAYCYKRHSLTINANVTLATHGETRTEVLGSGDGAQALQTFALSTPPLTYLPASTPSGAESTLVVRVNDVRWREADALAALGPGDRRFITRTGDDGKTVVVFGNGREGARLPTGVENVRATYRSGIGKAGNVRAGQISQLISRPLGVKDVVNPRRATGGADPDSRDQARKNAPLAVMALDRLVSVQDYADFARTFAGIAKASAVKLTDGRRQIVHVTIAGVDDIPIDPTSALYRNLVQALRDLGDPHQPFQVAVRELMQIVILAGVRIHVDYQWEKVAASLRTALLDAFSFEKRELGQDVHTSQIISVMQRVPGVEFVDLDALGAPTEAKLMQAIENLSAEGNPGVSLAEALGIGVPQRIAVGLAMPGTAAPNRARSDEAIRPAQIAFLTPDVPDTLILNEVTA
jgi:hypothetical protein